MGSCHSMFFFRREVNNSDFLPSLELSASPSLNPALLLVPWLVRDGIYGYVQRGFSLCTLAWRWKDEERQSVIFTFLKCFRSSEISGWACSDRLVGCVGVSLHLKPPGSGKMPPGGKCVVGTSRWLLGTLQAVIRMSESVGRCFLLLSFTDIEIMCSFRRHKKKTVIKSTRWLLISSQDHVSKSEMWVNVSFHGFKLIRGTYRRIRGQLAPELNVRYHLPSPGADSPSPPSDQAYLSLKG